MNRMLDRIKSKKLPLAVWYLCAYYRLEMLVVPAKKLEKKYGIRGESSPTGANPEEYREVRRISRHVNRVADKTPWQSKCLVRARAAQYLAHRKGIKTTLYLGVGKDESGSMVAHAWIRCGDFYMTGGNGEGYAEVARFCK